MCVSFIVYTRNRGEFPEENQSDHSINITFKITIKKYNVAGFSFESRSDKRTTFCKTFGN